MLAFAWVAVVGWSILFVTELPLLLPLVQIRTQEPRRWIPSMMWSNAARKEEN
jgi:hypothetical protein